MAEACVSQTHRQHQRCRPPVLKTGSYTRNHTLPQEVPKICPFESVSSGQCARGHHSQTCCANHSTGTEAKIQEKQARKSKRARGAGSVKTPEQCIAFAVSRS